MTVILLTSASSAPWTVPNDWVDAGHTVNLVGSGGNGFAGTTGTSGLGGAGGGGGGFTLLTYSSGNFLTGQTYGFQCKGGNATNDFTTNAACWEAFTSTNSYYSATGLPGTSNVGNGLGGSGGNQNGSPIPVTYTITTSNSGGTGGSSTAGARDGGGGGGGVGNRVLGHRRGSIC